MINGLTDAFHPCQVLADLLTLKEHFGQLKGSSLPMSETETTWPIRFSSVRPKWAFTLPWPRPPGYEPDGDIVRDSEQAARENGSRVTVTHDPHEAVKGADAVYTDVWASMGQEAEASERRKAFQGYQVNGELMAEAKDGAIFLHCCRRTGEKK